MIKAYIVSEEVLRQVLDALECVPEDYKLSAEDEIHTLRTILAKEPNEPVAWIYTSDITGGHLYKSEVLLQGLPANRMNYTPLYRKDV